MMTLGLSDIIEALTGHAIGADQKISSVVIDSRRATPDSLFVALPGEQTDGHAFVGQAFQNGAVATLAHQPIAAGHYLNTTEAGPAQIQQALSRLPVIIQVDDTLQALQRIAAFWRDKFEPRVIGITGSVGKSSTKELAWSVLSTRYSTLKSEGNYNNEIGLPLTLLNLNDRHERLVLEMGMYDLGEIELLCRLSRPHVGVITNVGPVHLERLGTIDRIAQAKSELIEALPDDGIAILNHDDPRVQAMADKTQARVMTYGLSPEADLWASDVTSNGLEGIRFVFHHGADRIHVRVPLLGRHSVHTALRAALIGLAEELAWEEIVTGLQALPSSSQLRLVAVAGPNGSTLLDDTYNANPASTIAALNLLDDLTGSKKIAVLGDMMELGSYEEEGHRKVGCRAADVVDALVVIGSRSKITAEEAIACGLPAGAVLELEDNQAAVDYLRTALEPDNIVLIKGSLSRRMADIVSALTVKNGEPQQGEAVG